MPVRLSSNYGARVLMYSELDSRHVRTEHWAQQWGQEFRPNEAFTQVVLCETATEPGVHLMCLNNQGAVVFSSLFPTLAEAKADIEAEFSGLDQTWSNP